MATQSRIRTAPRSGSARAGPVGRQARILALQALFAADVRGAPDAAVLDWLCAEEPARPSVRRNAERIAAAVAGDVVALDGVVQRFAPVIPVPLLAIVDRNILRMAIYELTNRETVPRQVMVKEAVELASMFGSASSARFVNGVLASFLHQRDSVDGAAATATDPPSESEPEPEPHPATHSIRAAD